MRYFGNRLGRGTIVVLIAGSLVRCEESVTSPANHTSLATSGRAFDSWRVAASIETPTVESGLPGADAGFNTDGLEGCPFVSRDGKSFYIAASHREGGVGGLDIWVSTRASVNDPWGAPRNVGRPVNSEADDFCPTIARDGHTFYFVSSRVPAEGVEGVDYCGGSDIYVTRLRDERGFEEPRNLGCQVNSAQNEFSPFPLPESGSGPVLYFSRKPGPDPGDLYMSRSHGGVFGPAELIPGVNSAADDGQPNVRRDGLELFFYSNRDAATGNDIFVATRASTSEPWSTPENLGPLVNSAGSETRPSLSWDGTTLYFGSVREGTGGSDIFATTRLRVPGN